MPEVGKLRQELESCIRYASEARRLAFPGVNLERRERLDVCAERLLFHAQAFADEMGVGDSRQDEVGG